MSNLIICFIHCLDCMGPIDDYDPAIDQYSCANCRKKAREKYERQQKRRGKRRQPEVTADTDLYSQIIPTEP